MRYPQDNHWTEAVDAEADVFFRTLTVAEIRRRQDLCSQQQRTAYEARNIHATLALQGMENALTREMLRRCRP